MENENGEVTEVDLMKMNHQELIDKYNDVRKERAKIRFLVTLMVICASTIPVTKIVLNTYSFFSNETVDLAKYTTEYLMQVPAKHEKQFKGAVDRVMPVYTKEFNEIASRDYPKFQQGLYKELEEVGQYAALKWPAIEKKIDEIAMSQERKFMKKISALTNTDFKVKQFDELMSKYKGLFIKKLNTKWIKMFLQYESAVSSLEKNMVTLTKAEPDLQREIKPIEAAGMLLEFAGVELQAGV